MRRSMVVSLVWLAGCGGDDADPRLARDAGTGQSAPADASDGAADAAARIADAVADPLADAAAPDAAPPAPEGLPRFAMPIHPDDRELIRATPVFGVDHDPEEHARSESFRCRNHAGRGFPLCYDEHDGSDFMLSGGFAVMDRGSARIVAAAGGEVVTVEDGHFDRCHADIGSGDIDCEGHEMAANRVHVRHANGWMTRYLHMKKGSVAVRVGQRVACGEVLGLVGSSGRSSAPHVHFEVRDPDGVVWDPFAGPESQPESLWVEQPPTGLPGAACDPAWGPVP